MLSVWAEESAKQMQHANRNALLPSLYHPSVESTRWLFLSVSIVALFFFFLGGPCSAASPRLDPVSLLKENSLEGTDSREIGPGMSSVESSVVLTQQNKYNEHTIGTINSVTHVSEKRWLPSFSFSFSLATSFTCTSTTIWRGGGISFLGIVGTSAAKITNTSNQVLINTDIQPSYNYMYLRWWTVSSRNDTMVNNGQVETTGGPSSPLFLFFTFFNSHTYLSRRLSHRFCKHYVWITHLWNI